MKNEEEKKGEITIDLNYSSLSITRILILQGIRNSSSYGVIRVMESENMPNMPSRDQKCCFELWRFYSTTNQSN